MKNKFKELENVDSFTFNIISLCAGVGMFDCGASAGLEFMGIRSRTILYAEREAYPVSVLAARMEEGSLDAAPIWFGDFRELPAKQFRGMVDCVIAGTPCQDLSIAGRREGLDGKRSGLVFDAIQIATDSGARFILLENVAGIATATASVVGEAEGELDERAAARVMGELADLGWNSEWIVISASDVGASHGRARWFCLAWKMGYAGFDAGSAEHRKQSEKPSSWTWKSSESNALADAEGRGSERQRAELTRRAEAEGTSEYLADTARNVGDGSGNREGWRGRRVCETGDTLDNADGIGAQRTGRAQQGIDSGCGELAYAKSIGNESRGVCFRDESQYTVAATNCVPMVDTSGTGLQIRGGGG